MNSIKLYRDDSIRKIYKVRIDKDIILSMIMYLKVIMILTNQI